MGYLRKELVYKAIEDAKPMPSFRNVKDKIAFTVHATFIASGFRLLATGPDAFDFYTLRSSSLEEVSIRNWNYHKDGLYGFKYFYPGLSWEKVFVHIIHGTRVGELLVYASRVSDDSNKTRPLEINMDEYAPKNEQDEDCYLENFEKLVRYIETDLVNMFDASPSDTKYHPLRHSRDGNSLAKCHYCVDYMLIDISDDGYVSVLLDNGDIKDDLRLPTDADLLKQIQDKYVEGKDLVVSVSMSAKGKEYICAVKEIRQ